MKAIREYIEAEEPTEAQLMEMSSKLSQFSIALGLNPTEWIMLCAASAFGMVPVKKIKKLAHEFLMIIILHEKTTFDGHTFWHEDGVVYLDGNPSDVYAIWEVYLSKMEFDRQLEENIDAGMCAALGNIVDEDVNA